MMRVIIGNEILKTFRKWRTYIGFIAVGVVVPLVEFGLKAEGGSLVRNMTRGLGRISSSSETCSTPTSSRISS